MGQNFVTAEPGQLFLLPPDAREWLPGRHLAWAVLEAAGELDVAPFTAWYRSDGQGRPAYHPRLMAGLVMYCYCKGIRSSRAIEMAHIVEGGGLRSPRCGKGRRGQPQTARRPRPGSPR
jgi:hypothetical protein